MSADSTAPPTGAHQVGDHVALHGEVAAVYTGQDGPRVDVKFDAGFRIGLDPVYLAVVAINDSHGCRCDAPGAVLACCPRYGPADFVPDGGDLS